MSYAICLDQNTPNFNINNLSANGFSIYVNLGNGFNTVIAQGIPANLLFPFPNGTCPYNVTLPQGTTQILVVDQCTFGLDVASVFSPENIAAGTITTTCCYAIINISQEPVPPPTFCETCPLTFDTFLTATTGSIIAGNLFSTCGPITDYTIGWYLNGNYSSPAIVSGYGNTFTYQFQHPLTGNSAVPVLAGNWEGIIHDITINGVTYSSVSGSAGGQSIPFESCFDTVVAQPLKCDNGAFQGIAKYSHQYSFNSQAVGAVSAPVSLTYALDPTTKYFAYSFKAFNIDDEIEIKWKSGNPNATPNPSFYSQSIYLEKLILGNTTTIPQGSYNVPSNTPTVNNIWPKVKYQFYVPGSGIGTYDFRRVLTLTSLPTSSNPLLPDLLEITITPNPINNNTQWEAGFQCLDDFICGDCHFSNWPNSLPKIATISLKKTYSCPSQYIRLQISGCLQNSDWMGEQNPFLTLSGNLINSYTRFQPPNLNPPNLNPPQSQTIQLKGTTSCALLYENPTINCSTTPDLSTITLTKSPGNVKLTFDSASSYNYYLASLTNAFNTLSTLALSSPITSPVSCPAGATNINTVGAYYRRFRLYVPIQLSSNANCGDNTTTFSTAFHINDYFNITYTANPSTNFWEISIPQSPIIDCFTATSCNDCDSQISNFIANYTNDINSWGNNFTFTTTVGAKYVDPFRGTGVALAFTSSDASGSVCTSQDFGSAINSYGWYNTVTVPFIPDLSNPGSWINLTNLSASLSCSTTPYSNPQIYGQDAYLNYGGFISAYTARFPNLTSSFNYSLSTNDFELYSKVGFGATGSINSTTNVWPPPCPDPLQRKIFSYIGGVSTVHSASYFVGGTPTLIIDP
jgi:hypothetical protein